MDNSTIDIGRLAGDTYGNKQGNKTREAHASCFLALAVDSNEEVMKTHVCLLILSAPNLHTDTT